MIQDLELIDLIDKANNMSLKKDIEKLATMNEKNVNDKNKFEDQCFELKQDNIRLQKLFKNYKKLGKISKQKSFIHSTFPNELNEEKKHLGNKKIEIQDNINPNKPLSPSQKSKNKTENHKKQFNQASEIIKLIKFYKLMDILAKIDNIPEFLTEIIM